MRKDIWLLPKRQRFWDRKPHKKRISYRDIRHGKTKRWIW